MKKILLKLLLAVSVFPLPTLAQQLLDDSGSVWQVSVMRQPAELARGLMFRLWLHEQQGMLFVFEPSRPTAFWMYQTYMPLAMRFYDAYGRLLANYPYVPPCYSRNPRNCPTYPAPGNSKYVLETRPSLDMHHSCILFSINHPLCQSLSPAIPFWQESPSDTPPRPLPHLPHRSYQQLRYLW